jgi:short-subunit dehydrogenase
MNTVANLGTAVVTGATGGVGALYAQGLAERGYDLLLVGRQETALQELADKIGKSTGRKVDIAAHDLSNTADLNELTSRLASDEKVSLLANIAGTSSFSPFVKLSTAEIDQTIAINITALTQLSHAVAPRFAERGQGTIVNFASVLAFRPWAEFNVYNATKAYVVMLSQSLQAGLGEKGVLVQVVAPPATATPFWETAGFNIENLPAKAVMKSEDLVNAALVGLDKREEWVLPSLGDASVWEAFQAARTELVKGMMNGTPAERYSKA